MNNEKSNRSTNKTSFLIVDILNTSNDDSDDNCSNINNYQRKSRTTFSDYQLNCLEESFEKNKYLSVQERIELANRLGLNDAQVKTWYQNRRTKWKRHNAFSIEWLMTNVNNTLYNNLPKDIQFYEQQQQQSKRHLELK